MEVLRGRKRALEKAAKKERETVLGHAEEAEAEEVTEVEKEEKQIGVVDPPRKRRTTQPEVVLKEEQKKQFMADQERRWLELTRGRHETRPKTKPSASLGAPVRSVAVTSTTTTTTATVSSSAEVTEEIDLEEARVGKGDEEETGYEKRYKTTAEDRTDRSKARQKQKEERQRNEQERKAMEFAEQEIQAKIADRQKQLSEQALLEQEEKQVEEKKQKEEERRKQLEEKEKERLQRKATELEKQRERERKRKDVKKDDKKKKKDGDEEEELPMVDDVEKDKDYDPEDDPEVEFVAEDQGMEEEDTFEVEKHVHALNIVEAGDYVVAMQRYMDAFERIVRRGKADVPKEYRKLIHFVKLMIDKLGAYSLIDAADVDKVYETIVDPQCVAWRCALHGAKTGNSKEILKIEEKRWKVERSIEQRDLTGEEEIQTFADTMQVKSKTEKTDVVRMVKKYFGHVAKAHEEAAAAARTAQLLIDEIDENSYIELLRNGTRPLIMLQVPEMLTQAADMKSEREQQQRIENLKGQPIEVVIDQQNMPRPVLRWADSKILSPSAYLAAGVYFFLYNTVDQTKKIPNQTVADMFGVSRSNLHKITSGRKYLGGSTTTARKAKSLQELEEHGESMVKVAKIKGKKRQKVQVTKAKQKPKLIDLPFLEDKPAMGTRSAHKRREDDDDGKPMIH